MNDKFAEIQSAANSGAFGVNGYALPTAEQCRAGNYRKGRVNLYGLDVAIETPQGTRRMGKSDGNPWSVTCMAHYGDISGTVGADGDPVDCYIGPVPESNRVFVVNQNGKDGAFDEHKVMLAFPDEEAARTAYMGSYERGWTGLGSIVPASVDQFTWWLRYGNTALPFSKNALPYNGDDDMNEIHWDSAAQPVNTDLATVMYGLRRGDPDSLALDSLTLADIHEDADSLEVLDALVIESQKLQTKLDQIYRIMERQGGHVKPVSLQISQPFKQKGTTNITALYELSDGQTVAIFFHNPDATPNTILPSDELVSWKWMLNKLDVTILVAPEKGRDLNPREVSRRIMALAEKNSARFAKANGARAERMAAIEQAKTDVTSKEEILAGLESEIAELTVKVEAKRAIQPPMPGDEQGATATETFDEMARRLVPKEFVSDPDPDGFTGIAADGYGMRLRMTGGGRMLGTYLIQPGITGMNSLGAKSIINGLESAMSVSVSTATQTIERYRANSKPVDLLQLGEAMKKVSSDGMWYADPAINDLVNRAKEQGFVYRNSTTQAGWTEAGIEALKAAKAAQAPAIDWAQAQELETNEAIRALGIARINDIGSENVYVEKNGMPFMFKPGNTEAYAIGAHDFSNDPTYAEPEHQGDPIVVQFGTGQTSDSSVVSDRDAWMRKNIPAEQLDTDGDEGVGSIDLGAGVIRNVYRTNDGQLVYWDMASRAFLAVKATDPRLTLNADATAKLAGVEAILKSTNWVKRTGNTWDRGSWQVTLNGEEIQVNEYQEGELVERGVVSAQGDEGATVKSIEDIISAGSTKQLTPDEQADADEQAKYAPFDRSKVKMPTAVQLNLNAKGMPILVQYGDQEGWTNGNILAFDKPKVVTDAITKYHVDEENLRTIQKDQVDRVIPEDATIPVEPVANFEFTQESQRSTVSKLQQRPQVKISAVVLVNQEAGVAVTVDARYFGYFDKQYKQPDYFASRDSKKPVVVKKNGKIVGLMMPMRAGSDALKRATRAAGIDGQVTPAAPGWETNGQSGILRRDTLTKEQLGSTYVLTVGGQYGSGYWNITKDGKEVRWSSDTSQMSFAQIRARGEAAFNEYLASEAKAAKDKAPAPAAQDDQLATARELLQSVIDGNTEMDAGLADRLQAVHDLFAGNAEFDALFEKAAQAFADAMVAKARTALAA